MHINIKKEAVKDGDIFDSAVAISKVASFLKEVNKSKCVFSYILITYLLNRESLFLQKGFVEDESKLSM